MKIVYVAPGEDGQDSVLAGACWKHKKLRWTEEGKHCILSLIHLCLAILGVKPTASHTCTPTELCPLGKWLSLHQFAVHSNFIENEEKSQDFPSHTLDILHVFNLFGHYYLRKTVV